MNFSDRLLGLVRRRSICASTSIPSLEEFYAAARACRCLGRLIEYRWRRIADVGLGTLALRNGHPSRRGPQINPVLRGN